MGPCPNMYRLVAVPAPFFGGEGKGDRKIFRGAEICHFNAEIVKIGLMLTHLKLFWGQMGGGQENILPPLVLVRKSSRKLQSVEEKWIEKKKKIARV